MLCSFANVDYFSSRTRAFGINSCNIYKLNLLIDKVQIKLLKYFTYVLTCTNLH